MANIRNSRRNYARPSGTFTATASTAAITVSNGRITSTVTVNKTSSTLGPVGNSSYTITSTPAAVNTVVTNTGTSFTATYSFPAGSATGQYSINVSENNYNGPGKPVVLTGAVSSLPASFNASLLVLGGGGAGGFLFQENNLGNFTSGTGGGGAGGYREFSNYAFSTGTAYGLRVGAGGTGSSYPSTNGNNSVLENITANGGGAGASWNFQYASQAAGNGGSGGGGSSTNMVGTNRTAGGSATGITPYENIELYTTQGNAGGSNVSASESRNGSGGGGAGAVGGNAQSSSAVGGNGGNGRTTSISGSSTTYSGGGGGGGTSTAGSGGSGGGGAGATSGGNGAAGAANLGGGGGGTSRNNSDGTMQGGNGGSGRIIIRIPSAFNATFSAGVTSSLSTSVSGVKIYSVTATSTTSETVTFSAA